MKYDVSLDEISVEKRNVLLKIESSRSLDDCKQARNLRSIYLRDFPKDWDVLAAGDLLDRVETALQNAVALEKA